MSKAKRQRYEIREEGDALSLIAPDASVAQTFTTDQRSEAIAALSEASAKHDAEFVGTFADISAMGVNLIVGSLIGAEGKFQTIQGVSFDKKLFDVLSARAWLDFHGFWAGESFRTKSGRLIFDLRDPESFDKKSMETMEGVEPSKNRQQDQEDDDDPILYALDEVEIFRAGTWNGDKYTVADIDAIVEAFDQVGFKPPLKFGHEPDREEIGAPALGWVAALRRNGEKLIADFIDMPKAVYDAIRRRAYDQVSSEIFFNLRRNGQMYPVALKAVALLGAEVPAVSHLKPLRQSNFDTDATSATYNLTLKELTTMTKKPDPNAPAKTAEELAAELEAAQTKIKELTQAGDANAAAALQVKNLSEDLEAMRKEMAANAEKARKADIEVRVAKLTIPAFTDHVRAMYDMASKAESSVNFTVKKGGENDTDLTVPALALVDDFVSRLNRFSEKIFGSLPAGGREDRREGPVTPTDDVGAEIDRLTKAHMAKHGVKSYSEAQKAVKADPEHAELFRIYAGTRG